MEAKSKKEMATEVSAETMQVAEVASAAVMTTKAAQTRKKWNAISYQRNRSEAVSAADACRERERMKKTERLK